MNDQELLQAKAKFYCKKLWGMELDIPVKFNGRLYQTMGYIYYTNDGLPERIEIAKCLMGSYYSPFRIDDVLLHELTHWYCTKTGKDDWDGSIDFENELKKNEISSTRVCGQVGLFYTTKCSSCGGVKTRNRSESRMKRYLNNDIYSSLCCNSKLIQGEQIVLLDEYEPPTRIKQLVREFEESIIEKQ